MKKVLSIIVALGLVFCLVPNLLAQGVTDAVEVSVVMEAITFLNVTETTFTINTDGAGAEEYIGDLTLSYENNSTGLNFSLIASAYNPASDTEWVSFIESTENPDGLALEMIDTGSLGKVYITKASNPASSSYGHNLAQYTTPVSVENGQMKVYFNHDNWGAVVSLSGTYIGGLDFWWGEDV